MRLHNWTEWSFVTRESGEQFVMIFGMRMMPVLCVDNLVFPAKVYNDRNV